MSDKWFVVYTTSAFECKWCNKLKQLLSVYGYEYFEKDITDEQYLKEFKEQGFKTVPQVFLNTKTTNNHIGGYETTKDYLRRNFFTAHPNQDEIIKQLEELE